MYFKINYKGLCHNSTNKIIHFYFLTPIIVKQLINNKIVCSFVLSKKYLHIKILKSLMYGNLTINVKKSINAIEIQYILVCYVGLYYSSFSPKNDMSLSSFSFNWLIQKQGWTQEQQQDSKLILKLPLDYFQKYGFYCHLLY